ncbi:hypothetical protein TNCV_1870831 [Trichonephila clavipes]|nr:hypothetical protein TNCV_1870831 [Trichonephila clavipes]
MKKSAAEAHRMLSNTCGEAAISERTCREWFQRFKNGDFDVEDQHGIWWDQLGYSLVRKIEAGELNRSQIVENRSRIVIGWKNNSGRIEYKKRPKAEVLIAMRYMSDKNQQQNKCVVTDTFAAGRNDSYRAVVSSECRRVKLIAVSTRVAITAV